MIFEFYDLKLKMHQVVHLYVLCQLRRGLQVRLDTINELLLGLATEKVADVQDV
jgi:hypothetical protein